MRFDRIKNDSTKYGLLDFILKWFCNEWKFRF